MNDTVVNNPVEQGSANPIKPVVFSGTTREFFGIWIVNLVLTILTLGIYSAWAKVRTYRYFYSHTRIDGHAFRYLAEPMQILIGRLIAVALFAAYSLAGAVSPIVGAICALVLLVIAPWLINKSVGFGLRMTSYRNVRFNFHGNYGDALVCFILLPIVAVMTLGLAYPWVLKMMDEYIYSNISFSKHKLSPHLRTSEYYWSVVVVIAALVFIMLCFFTIVIVVATGVVSVDPSEQATATSKLLFTGGLMLFYFVAFNTVYGIFHARIRNHIYRQTHFSEFCHFQSNLPVAGYVWLICSNTLAVIATLGLAYPWAKIRKAQYLAQYTYVKPKGNMDELMDEVQEESSALAEEAAGIFDMEIGLT